MVTHLLLLSLCFVFSLLIFQSGFLLRRKELHMRSQCSDAKLYNSKCWMQRQYGRVVVLLVDALRYDFMVPLEDGAPPSFFRGQMPGVAKLVIRGGQIGLLLADPPTTTLQRIKALTTGTLPTFIDAGDNFAPSHIINEDNILSQARSRALNVTFMGDQTWTALYPNVFTRAHPFDSFDINDLNTVDDAVRVLLRDEFAQLPPADLVFVHLLGVDHCGHKYGPSHIQMSNTLWKMDKIIMETADALSDNDLLIVLGDHGMTTTGDHGGDSDDETHAGLLVFSPSQKFDALPGDLRQIDLVPSISLLLGLPIPFSNLGIVISSLFPKNLINQAVALNYEQMRRFANTYATANPSFDFSEILAHDSVVPMEQLSAMRRLQASLRAAWTQFDISLMRLGLLCFMEALLFTLSSRRLTLIHYVMRSGCLLLQLSLILSGSSENLAAPLLLCVLPLSAIHSVISILSHMLSLRRISCFSTLYAYICVSIHSVAFLSNSYVVYEGHVVRYLTQSVLIVSGVEKVLSNELVRKSSVAFVFSCFCSLSFDQSWDLSLLCVALLLIRSESFFHRCREEEVNCQQSIALELLTSLSPDALLWRTILATTLVFSWNIFIGRILPDTISNSLRVARALSWPMYVGLTVYHLVQLYPQTEVMQKRLQLLSIAIALVVYVCSATAAVICICAQADPRRVIHLCFVNTVCGPLFLLLGDGLQPSLVAFLVILYASLHFCNEAVIPPLFSLLIPLGFYLTGHSPTLPAIPWQAAFVGLPGNFPLRILPASLILSHICVSALLVPLVIPLRISARESLFPLVGCSAISSLFSCIAAAIHKRHLMVWKIFAPRFIFESVLFIYLLIMSNLTLLICKRLKIF
ncbi:hypothetical protein KIN20_005482 [Parelaphostrongylus tenuis]|uniref:GPI ethanolamine phosphate transferase 3 n=1 Tax=Parelaphostrongylus tenuis TaxID=148309 RepID=A0AAD5MSU2_PARTN|nr:hypothetical protein KIN20_005482 [Parelaphostrongylus tenuis]